MYMNNYRELDDEHADILREIGNIGTGNALTSLSQLTGKQIIMDLPHIRIDRREKITTEMANADSRYVGITLNVDGDFDSVVTFLLSEHFTNLVLVTLLETEEQNIDRMDEMGASALCEIGNIMCNSYLNALCAMIGAEVGVSVPGMIVGSASDIFYQAMPKNDETGDDIMLIENTFHYEDQQIVSHIVLHPRMKGLNMILSRLSGE